MRQRSYPKWPWSTLPGSNTPSQVSVASRDSKNPVLRWLDLKDGMVGRAHNSVTHPVVTALSSVVSEIRPGSRVDRDLTGLDENRGKYRPFIVTQQARGRGQPPRIVLITHFSYVPIDKLDRCSQLLAVALGTVTLPHPLPTSTRIQIEPEWTDQNSYTIAYPIELKAGRRPTRLEAAEGVYYQVNKEELGRLRDICEERINSLATLPAAALAVVQNSYNTHRPPRAGRRRGTQATQSAVSTLAAIAENEPQPATPATPTAPVAQTSTTEDGEGVWQQVARKRRSSKLGSTRGG